MTNPAAPGRRRILDRWRLVSPTGARVVSLRQLPKRERARLLGGTLMIESAQGAGTRIAVTLPAHESVLHSDIASVSL